MGLQFQHDTTGDGICYVLHRRFDDHMERYIDFKSRRGKVDESSGRLKAYRMPLNILLFAGALEWYAVGNLGEVQELCRGIVSVGKKSAQGYGFVDCWEVVPWPEDWSESWNGRITRALPAEQGLPPGVKVANMRQYGIRPPYWRRESQAIVFMPEVRE
ncbi:MAG: hypothetical protein RQM92_09455 [Candidatus Syntrophopropionicum ammoniitolerans]